MLSRVSIVLLVIALLTLAGLQFHWIGQISVAERQQLEASVRDSSLRFAADFNQEIRSLTNVLDFRGYEPSPASIAARYRGWAENSVYPELFRKLYVIRSGAGDVSITALNADADTFEPAALPTKLEPLRMLLQHESLSGDRRNFPNASRGLSILDGTSALMVQLGGRPMDPQRGRGGPGGSGPDSGRGRGQDGARGPDPGPRGPVPDGGRGPDFGRIPGFQSILQNANPYTPERAESWLIAELDEAVLTKQVFPALVMRDFPMTGDQNYRVAVVSSPSSATVFSTGKPWTLEDMASYDFGVDLIGMPGQFGQIDGFGRGGPRFGGRGGGPQSVYLGQGLRLLVKHEAGSLETAVANLRRRNLAISFGILLVLGLGAGVGIVSGQRARTLGKLQMEFAAGVSHELRTPLAVIQSAAHNLRAGVVRSREGIEEYATIVQKEARRLSDMVEQVMTYAETQSGRKRYHIEPLDLNAIVDRTLQNMALPLADANASIENRIDPQLPRALADEMALTQCIQNLLSNAVKYGGSSDSVQIEIESEVDRSAGTIRLTVTDHGAGVPPADEPFLFDPFHRGANATTNTPGNGLGLHLVRRMMQSQDGTLTYRRAATGGACFMLTLPLAKEAV